MFCCPWRKSAATSSARALLTRLRGSRRARGRQRDRRRSPAGGNAVSVRDCRPAGADRARGGRVAGAGRRNRTEPRRASCSPASTWCNVAAGNAFCIPPSGDSPATDSGACSARSIPSIRTWPRSTRPGPISLASTVVHWPAGSIGVAEVLIVFAFMGHPISIAEALVIESLLHAIRGAAFAIPGALGAQEGGSGAAVRRVRHSAGTGDRAVAGQAGRRSRARRARPSRLAEAGMATPRPELFARRRGSRASPSIPARKTAEP